MFRSKVGCKGCGRKSGKRKLREVLGEVSLLDIGNRKKQKSTPLAPTHVFSLCQSCYLKIHRKKKKTMQGQGLANVFSLDIPYWYVFFIHNHQFVLIIRISLALGFHHA